MPAGFKTNPLLAEAEPVRLKKGEKVAAQQQLQPEREVRVCERNNSADTKVSEGEGGGVPAPVAEISPKSLVKIVVRQAVPLQPMEVHGRADILLQPMEKGPHTGAGGCAQRSL
ncbi:protein pxr1-like [Limosa lapponica baueri]|uniref:Protein pxr1-like n=1 Tax=Limosa lapponica baueri TaxID=1758121 RepID=A0A2I0U0G5_LIMLA|nr:protein pxr1-like [Limosa lapponica baueri]